MFSQVGPIEIAVVPPTALIVLGPRRLGVSCEARRS
jgi:Sec-independent protein translocase protein TatA